MEAARERLHSVRLLSLGSFGREDPDKPLSPAVGATATTRRSVGIPNTVRHPSLESLPRTRLRRELESEKGRGKSLHESAKESESANRGGQTMTKPGSE